MLIRPATIDDMKAVGDIWNYYIAHTSYNFDYTTKPPAYFEEWLLNKQGAGWPVFIVEVEGKVAGYGYYSKFRERDAYLHTAEHSLYFDPAFQGRGYGKILLEHLMADAKKRNFHTFVAVIAGGNEGSVIFHERMGFHKTGMLKDAGFKNNRWIDLIFLQKML